MMDFGQKMKLIQHNFDVGGYTIAAKECVGLIEQALRELFRRHVSHLDEKDRINVQKAELEIGKGEKGIEHFTMGQLVGLFRTSHFFDAWARASGKDLSSVRVINLDELTTLRNKFMHEGIDATRAEAEFLFDCLQIMLETFGIASLEDTEGTFPSRPEPQTSKLGPFVSQMCNRNRQEIIFVSFSE